MSPLPSENAADQTPTGPTIIDAEGTILSEEGDYALVRMDESGCGRCHEPGGCGGQNLSRMLCSTPRVFRVPNPGGAKAGDRVRVAVDSQSVSRSAVFAYVLPLLALFAGALVGMAFAGEAGSIAGAALGLLAAWFSLRRRLALRGPDRRFQPYIRT